MGPYKTLVVDDEVFNLDIIAEYLESPEFELTTFTSANAAWEHLQANDVAYRVILLDRMMPGMNGIELLRRLKADPRFRRVPVIMQTAAASSTEVEEGVAAGAYYYLAKPYSSAELLAIVRAALADPGSMDGFPAEAAALAAMRPQATEFEFSTLAQAREIAMRLAALCPHPELTAVGLLELLINAIEHGNLGLSYAEKKCLRLRDAWDAELQMRQRAPEYAGRVARVSVTRTDRELIFTVTDCGSGFDWQRYMEIDPERAYDPNGRGIAMARQLSFKHLRYEGCGNVAVAVVSLTEQSA